MRTPLSSQAADLTRIVSCTVAELPSFLLAMMIACLLSSATWQAHTPQVRMKTLLPRLRRRLQREKSKIKC
jgi:hypothetical protein